MKNTKAKIIVALVVLIIIFSGILAIIKLNKFNDEYQVLKATPNVTNVSIISPSGAPALSLVGIIEDATMNVDYEIVDGSDVLASEFTKAEKDLIIAPVNLGNKLINNGAEYKMLAVVSWGNLYIVSSDNYYNKIAAFGEGAVPGKILNYVDEALGDTKIDYFSSVQEASSMLLSGEYKAALLAEPVLSMTNAKYMSENEDKELRIVYDLQKLYESESGFSSYPQAAIFVRNETITNNQKDILNITNKIRSSISLFNNSPEELLTLTSVDFKTLGFNQTEILVEAYPKMALNFVYANECVDEVRSFLDLFEMSYQDTNYIK